MSWGGGDHGRRVASQVQVEVGREMRKVAKTLLAICSVRYGRIKGYLRVFKGVLGGTRE